MEQLERVTDHLLVDLLHKQKEKKKEKAEKLDHFALNRFGEAAEDVESVVITPSAESDEAQKWATARWQDQHYLGLYIYQNGDPILLERVLYT